jgi:hypothetical protein
MSNINKNLEKAIAKSLKSFEEEESKKNNSPPPDGWVVVKVPMDGTCGFHAIMKCLSYQGNTNYRRISNNNLVLRYTLENRGINFNEKSGFALRHYCAKILEDIKNEISSLEAIINNKNIPRTNKGNVNKRLQYLISEYKLDNRFPNNQSGISENNIENPTSYLTAIIKKLRNFNINKSTDEWLTEQILVIISVILKKNIFIFYRGNWKQINYEKPCNPNNSIFLKFNGIHYDALIPSTKFFKNRFNVPNTYEFKYNFLRKIE